MATSEELESRVRALEARLRTVEDVEAIRRLKARYAKLVDERYESGRPRDPERLAELAGHIAELFTEDAVWDGGPALGVCRGRAAIRERLRAPTLRFSCHYFVQPEIAVHGDAASGRWDLLAPCTDARGRAFWLAGVEEDEYARVAGDWLHQRMALRVVFLAPHDEGWAKRMERGRSQS